MYKVNIYFEKFPFASETWSDLSRAIYVDKLVWLNSIHVQKPMVDYVIHVNICTYDKVIKSTQPVCSTKPYLINILD